MIHGVHSEGLAVLGDDVCDVDQRCARTVDGVDDAGHDERRRDRRVQAPGTEDDLIRRLDRGDGALRDRSIGRQHADGADRPASERYVDLSSNLDPVDVGRKLEMPRRRRDHGSERTEKAFRGAERCFKRAFDVGERRDDQVAERVAPNVGTVEPVLEQLTPYRVVRRQGDEGLPYVPGRRDIEVGRKPARRSSVVGDRDDRVDPSGVAADGFERPGETLPSPDGDDMGSASGRGSVPRGAPPAQCRWASSSPRPASRWWTVTSRAFSSEGARQWPRRVRRNDAGRPCSRPRS